MGSETVFEKYLPGVCGAAVFYLLAFAWSWLAWGTLIWLPQTADWAPLIILLGAYGPPVAALLLVRLGGGRGAIREWLRVAAAVRGRWRWILLGAVGLPLLLPWGTSSPTVSWLALLACRPIRRGIGPLRPHR